MKLHTTARLTILMDQYNETRKRMDTLHDEIMESLHYFAELETAAQNAEAERDETEAELDKARDALFEIGQLVDHWED